MRGISVIGQTHPVVQFVVVTMRSVKVSNVTVKLTRSESPYQSLVSVPECRNIWDWAREVSHLALSYLRSVGGYIYYIYDGVIGLPVQYRYTCLLLSRRKNVGNTLGKCTECVA